MNLTTKINLILAATILPALLLASVNFYLLAEDNALQQVTDQAELVMQEVLAVRSYTVNEIRPLLNRDNAGEFHLQALASYAAAQTADLLRQSRPDYNYREAMFNPTNPRDKASPEEEQIIKQFIADPDLVRLVGNLEIDDVKTRYVAFPIRLINPKCLACHGAPEQAPAAMRELYGNTGGFGWKLNEVIGTQLVTVPFALSDTLAGKTFIRYLISLIAIFLVLFLILNFTIRKLVLTPVSRLTRMADEISQGNLKGVELKVSGEDELAEMSTAFNHMRRRIIKIVQLVRKMKAQNNA